MHHRSIPHLPNPRRQLRVPPAAARSFGESAPEYRQVRPSYPDAIVQAVATGAQVAVDIGAGTGIFTAQLADRVGKVIAVEPDARLTRMLQARNIATQVASGEDTGLPDRCCDVVSYAQAWHWVESAAASAEAARILRPGGKLCLVWNQLDVSRPWVHRLSRIMRSGDVHPVDIAPKLPAEFDPPARTLRHFSQQLSPDDVLALARTRSSYLRARPKVQRRMQDNLAWYMHDYLRFRPGSSLWLPYRSVAWCYRRRGDEQ